MFDRERLDSIFECIVRNYIETATPVGSRVIAEQYPGKLSPASIRSVMAALEGLGFLSHPHTSAGRVPTGKGYRYYVDVLMDREEAGLEEIPGVATSGARSNIEDVAESLSHTAADLTQNIAILLLRDVRRVSYVGDPEVVIDAPGEGESAARQRVYCEGTGYLLDQPEFSDLARLREILRALEDRDVLVSLLDRRSPAKDVEIDIGNEIGREDFSDLSMISKAFSFRGRPMGRLAVLGPTRMRYDRATSVVSRIADYFTDFLDSM